MGNEKEWMNILLFITGLLMLGAGVILSYYRKGGGSVWAIFIFGFLLIVIGSPIHGSLSGLSVTTKGLEFSFKIVEPSPEQLKSIDTRAQNAVKSLSPDQEDGLPFPIRQAMNKSQQGVIEEIISYVRSYGFTPTELIGAAQLQPGTIVTLQKGHPMVIATAGQAFSTLPVKIKRVFFERMQVENVVPEKQEDRVNVSFDCSSVQLAEIPIADLKITVSEQLWSRLSTLDEYFVVQSVITCSNPKFFFSVLGGKFEGRNVASVRVGEEIILGYKLLSSKTPKATSR